MTEFQIRARSYLFRGGVVLAFVILAVQLWNLQIVQGETYKELADANRFRLTQVPAPRGVIYDQNGELLVRNRPIYNVVIIPAYLPDDDTEEAQVFARLSELLNLPITTVGGDGYFHAITHHQYNRQLQRQIVNPRSRQFANSPRGIRDAVNQERETAPFLPVEIAEDVDPVIVARIEEERLYLPGVVIDVQPNREYLYDELVSHLLGYVGPIPAEQFDRYQGRGYDITDVIGLAGLELEYEEWLHGIKGLERIEVDVTGQKLRTVSQNIEARPGYNLRLSIDLELQQAAAEALQEEMDEIGSEQGVAIAMNPQTGEILAMVSLPSFDNNLFSRGITARELSLLSEDPWTPLINHAIAGLYPPGSTYKIIPAAGALQERTVFSDTIFYDEGVLYLPNKFEPDNEDLAQPFYCWLRTGHGEVNMLRGLAHSCDVYFYQVGGGYPPSGYEGLGLDRLVKYSEMFGLGRPTGIDLPGEVAGLVPTSKWKRLNYAETWVTGDTYNMSIGQGFVLATPLQVLNATAAIANGGTLYRPYLVQEVVDAEGQAVKINEPEVIRRLDVEPRHIWLIQQGLREVVLSGTAQENIDVPGIPVSGKTGTAEYCDEYPQCLDGEGRVRTSHAWFTAYAPSANPTIATVVFIYGGDEGSETAIPVTNQILRHYFGIAPAEEEPAPDSEEAEPELPAPETRFRARLLGTDHWNSNSSLHVSGFVLDERGRGLGMIPVEIVADGEVVDQVTTGPNGRFDSRVLDAGEADLWQFRLADYPESRSLQLDLSNGLRYLLEFQAQPVDEES